jgi:hypothetical protein
MLRFPPREIDSTAPSLIRQSSIGLAQYSPPIHTRSWRADQLETAVPFSLGPRLNAPADTLPGITRALVTAPTAAAFRLPLRVIRLLILLSSTRHPGRSVTPCR